MIFTVLASKIAGLPRTFDLTPRRYLPLNDAPSFHAATPKASFGRTALTVALTVAMTVVMAVVVEPIAVPVNVVEITAAMVVKTVVVTRFVGVAVAVPLLFLTIDAMVIVEVLSPIVVVDGRIEGQLQAEDTALLSLYSGKQLGLAGLYAYRSRLRLFGLANGAWQL